MDVRHLHIPTQSRATPRDSEGGTTSQLATPLIAAVLTDELITPVFQPIVDLDSGETVAFEALARGPAGSALATPDALFAAARAAGMLAELDWLCRVRALETAVACIAPPVTAFINVEPQVAAAPIPRHLRQRFRDAAGQLPVVIEFTERSLVAEPGRLLATAERVRALGWGIALDDVGADSHSLALMPFLRPDVIKLDLRLVQARPDVEIARIMTAVSAQVERTGCEALAEGIETADHVDLARALGARLGQGWYFGRPAALAERAVNHSAPLLASAVRLIERIDLDSARTQSLYAVAAAERTGLRSTKPLLIAMSKLLEREAAPPLRRTEAEAFHV